jgi:hypothetical protein
MYSPDPSRDGKRSHADGDDGWKRGKRLDCPAGGPVQSEIQNLKFEVKQAQEARDLAMYERRLKDQEQAMGKMKEGRKAREKLFEATIAEQQSQIRSLQNCGSVIL